MRPIVLEAQQRRDPSATVGPLIPSRISPVEWRAGEILRPTARPQGPRDSRSSSAASLGRAPPPDLSTGPMGMSPACLDKADGFALSDHAMSIQAIVVIAPRPSNSAPDPVERGARTGFTWCGLGERTRTGLAPSRQGLAVAADGEHSRVLDRHERVVRFELVPNCNVVEPAS